MKVKDLLPSLFDGLHMIWVLSRHYGSDETMVPLLERIAWCLCDKTVNLLDNEKLFRYNGGACPYTVLYKFIQI